MNKTIILSLAAFAVGLVCVILSRIVSADEFSLRLLFGVGVALVILGFANAVSEFVTSRVSTPETNKTKNIEEHDERNIQVRSHAGLMASQIMLYVLSLCTLVAVFADFDFYVTLLFVGLTLLQVILIVALTIYYDKRM